MTVLDRYIELLTKRAVNRADAVELDNITDGLISNEIGLELFSSYDSNSGYQDIITLIETYLGISDIIVKENLDSILITPIMISTLKAPAIKDNYIETIPTSNPNVEMSVDYLEETLESISKSTTIGANVFKDMFTRELYINNKLASQMLLKDAIDSLATSIEIDKDNIDKLKDMDISDIVIVDRILIALYASNLPTAISRFKAVRDNL